MNLFFNLSIIKCVYEQKKNIIHIGDIAIGGNHPIAIQSMLSCHPAQKKLVLHQLRELEDVVVSDYSGCFS